MRGRYVTRCPSCFWYSLGHDLVLCLSRIAAAKWVSCWLLVFFFGGWSLFQIYQCIFWVRCLTCEGSLATFAARAGWESPPLQDDVLAWSCLFRCPWIFSNCIGHLRLAWEILQVSTAALDDAPLGKKSKTAIDKRRQFVPRRRLMDQALKLLPRCILLLLPGSKQQLRWCYFCDLCAFITIVVGGVAHDSRWRWVCDQGSSQWCLCLKGSWF